MWFYYLTSKATTDSSVILDLNCGKSCGLTVYDKGVVWTLDEAVWVEALVRVIWLVIPHH